MAALLRITARHPVLAFMLISVGVGFVMAAIPPIVDSEILPFGLPLHGVGMSLGAGFAAFLLTAALSGRAGVADLTRRSVRWRVPLRWYLVALFTVPVGATLLSLASSVREHSPHPPTAGRGRWRRSAPSSCCSWCCFSWLKRSVSTGFLQHHWQDRYHKLA
jgi:hypothetical protein